MMTTTKRTGWIALLISVVLFGAAGDLAAQAGGRVSAKVLDENGDPIQGVSAIVTSPEMETIRYEKTTNKKGMFLVAFSDSGIPYVVELKKEGFKTVVAPINPQAGQTRMVEYVMPPAAANEQAAAEMAALSGAGRAIAVYNEGVKAQQAGDLELAAERFREAAKINPELAAAHTSLAGVAYLQEDYETAAAEAESALAIDPADFRALQLRYDAYRLAGNEEKAQEAAEALKEVGGLQESAKRVFNEGAEAYNSGDMATAMVKFQQAADLDPGLLEARVVLARYHYEQNHFDQALVYAQQAVEINAGNSEVLQIAYDAARRLGQTEVAADALDKLAVSDPEWAATGLFEMAVELYNAGQTDDATQALEKVLAVEPDHARAHYLLGLANYSSGQQESATEHLNRFLELAPDDPDASVAQEILSYAQK
jgi:tetratricopeptide (TPR) repeat protein